MGFPAMYYHFILCPFLPAGRQGPRLSRQSGTGHVPVTNFVLDAFNHKREISLSSKDFFKIRLLISIDSRILLGIEWYRF